MISFVENGEAVSEIPRKKLPKETGKMSLT
jgi:hypothetical protein